jgi:hypothetical protein
VLAQPPDGPLADLDERPGRRRSEAGAPEAFVALDADVAPQLELFGGAPAAPARTPAPVAFAGPAAVSAEPAELPAFRRRARLRDKRQGLVRALADVDGRSHREINAWLNRQTGTPGVRDASLEQLEQSVELLLAQLDRRSRARAS